MILGISIAEFMAFAAVMAGGAVLAGFIAGLFGVGGGVVMVPILTELFALGLGGSSDIHAQHLAVGTSLAIIIPTSIQSARTHYASGTIDMALLRRYLFFVPLGVMLGLYLATIMDAGGLGLVFGAIALCVGVYQLVASPSVALAKQVPGTPIAQGTGLFIGTASTLMGIGGGVAEVVGELLKTLGARSQVLLVCFTLRERRARRARRRALLEIGRAHV